MGIEKANREEIITFFIVNFGLVAIMSIFMYFSEFKENYVLLQMFYPAVGVMIALKRNPERKKELPSIMYNVFLLIFSVSLVLNIILDFIFNIDMMNVLSIIIIIGSLAFWAAYWKENEEKILNYGLKFRTYRTSFRYIIIYILTIIGRMLFSGLFLGEFKEIVKIIISSNMIKSLFYMLPLFFISVLPYFGEEYGWRFFLQPVLQDRYGRRKGVMILGIIWGLWHLPINIMVYSPETAVYSILFQIIFCVFLSIFMGWVYMRTDNIWAVTAIHLLNNNLFAFTTDGSMETVWNFKYFIISVVSMVIVYSIYLFAKEYDDKYPLIMEYRESLDELDS